MSLPEERPSYKEPSSPVGMTRWTWQHCLSHQVQKNDGNSNQFVNDEPFIDKRKPLSMTAVKGVLNNDEHTLIPVTANMTHSAVWDSKRFVLKDGRPLHMVKLIGAVRNFCVNIKHVQIDVEDGTGLVRVILWRIKRMHGTASLD
jgi:hypothetical protein